MREGTRNTNHLIETWGMCTPVCSDGYGDEHPRAMMRITFVAVLACDVDVHTACERARSRSSVSSSRREDYFITLTPTLQNPEPKEPEKQSQA